LVDGEVVEVPGAGGVHVTLMLRIFDILRAFVDAHALGMIYPVSFTYKLGRNPDILRIPDISFITSGRIPEEWPPVGYSEVVPDLAVEIVSPTNSAADLRRRTQDYLGAGVSQVWIVWPDDESVSVYADNMTPTELSSDDRLDGGDVLPGFSVKVGDLFAHER
jgi:Uma2 family endonuclease